MSDLDRDSHDWEAAGGRPKNYSESQAEHLERHSRHHRSERALIAGNSAASEAALAGDWPTYDRLMDAEQSEKQRPGFRLVYASELKPRPMDWQIQDLFEADTLLLIVGDPSAGKSFWMIDMGCCVATGTPHHGRAVKQGPVVYIAGEGHNGLARRLKAWQIKNQVSLDGKPLLISTQPAVIGDPVNTSMVLAAIDELGMPPSLVVLDTLNRNMAGDENATADMRAFVQACDEIRTAHRCTVALVHHTGHGDKTRARGSSVLHGAIDTTFMVTKTNSVVAVECTRMKDGPIPDPFAFKFRTVELGFDNEDGTEAVSAALHPCDMPTQTDSKPKGKNTSLALMLLRKRMEQQRQVLEAGGHHPDKARVSVDDWRQDCFDAGMVKRSFYYARDALISGQQIEVELGGFVREVGHV